MTADEHDVSGYPLGPSRQNDVPGVPLWLRRN